MSINLLIKPQASLYEHNKIVLNQSLYYNIYAILSGSDKRMPNHTPRTLKEPEFVTEDKLVKEFCRAISNYDNPWKSPFYNTEFDYQRGRTDIVASSEDDRVIAFEAKLHNWRSALQQAFRCTSFAHESYVLVPKDVAIRISKYGEEFSKRSVGLCYLDEGEIVVSIKASEQKPVQPWLSAKAIDYIMESNV